MHPRLDMLPKLVSQCGFKVVFAQIWPEDNELWARVLFGDRFEFKPLEHLVERHGGYFWLKVLEVSRSLSGQRNWSHGLGVSQTDTTSIDLSASNSEERNWSNARNWQTEKSESRARAQANAQTLNAGESDSPIIVDGQKKDMLTLKNMSRAQMHSEQNSDTRGHSSGTGGSETAGGSRGNSFSLSQGKSAALGTSQNDTDGGSESWSVSISEKVVHLAKIVVEKQLTGQLERAINDQLEQFRQLIANLSPRTAIVKIGNAPARLMEVVPVPDSFKSPEARERAFRWVKRQIDAVHHYMFVPDFTPEEEERRLRKFLGMRAPGTQTDVPLIVERDDRNPLA